MRRSDFLYTPYYCEENVWHLAGDKRINGDRRSVIFISNRARQCFLYQQRASESPPLPVCWDYHVIFSADRLIYDLDTRLPFPCDAKTYLDGTFAAAHGEPPQFRVIDAGEFRRTFASDRSHMKMNGQWTALPPQWPPIGEGMNLMRFVDMEESWIGEVVDLPTVYKKLSP